MQIELTDEQAALLYQYLESNDGPNYWDNPLAPVQQQLSDWYMTDG